MIATNIPGSHPAPGTAAPIDPSRVPSTSDARTVNNVMRHEYRVLTDAEKAQMQDIKDLGAAFVAKLHAIGGTDPAGERLGSAHLTLAMRHAEDAVYRAVKHITT